MAFISCCYVCTVWRLLSSSSDIGTTQTWGCCGMWSPRQSQDGKIHWSGAIYILNAVLPILSSLSKTFQKGKINFSHIKPSVDFTLDKLSSIIQRHLSLIWRGIFCLGHAWISQKLAWPLPWRNEQLLNLLNNYVSSLKANIHRRFDDALPVVSAFSIFDPWLFQILDRLALRIMVRKRWLSWPSTSTQATPKNTSLLQNGKSSSMTQPVGNLPFQRR